MLLLKLKLVRFTLPMCSQYGYVGTHWKCRLHGIIYLVKGMSLTDFSKRSGIQYRTLQDYVADKILPGSESLVKVHEELRVSLNWLLTGERLVLGIAQQLLLFKEMERRIMGG